MSQRGNSAYDQIRQTARNGTGVAFQMFGGGSATTGHLLIYDSSGNAVDGGSAPPTGTQAANTFYAGPASGGAAAQPTFRTQVAADVPQVIKVNGVLRG